MSQCVPNRAAGVGTAIISASSAAWPDRRGRAAAARQHLLTAGRSGPLWSSDGYRLRVLAYVAVSSARYADCVAAEAEHAAKVPSCDKPFAAQNNNIGCPRLRSCTTDSQLAGLPSVTMAPLRCGHGRG